jgi:two-component system sensor histidine kinase LytS
MLFDVERAKDLLISLADLFRKSLRSNQELVDIQTELQHIESYFEIEKARFGDKLQVKYELEDNLFFKFPPLILQPIIENAVIHGILPKKQGGLVTIRSSKAEKDVLLEVIDNGVGIDHATIENILAKVSDAKSVGLQNFNKRLINLYGEDYKLIIKSEADKGTVVQIKIPRHA